MVYRAGSQVPIPKHPGVACEGKSSHPHPHAFGHRVSCACPNKAKWKIVNLNDVMGDVGNFCGRCVKRPIKWRG